MGAVLSFPFLLLCAVMGVAGLTLWTVWQDACFETLRFLDVYDQSGPTAACAEPITALFPCPDAAARRPVFDRGMEAANALVSGACRQAGWWPQQRYHRGVAMGLS